MAASAPNTPNTPDPRPTGDLEHLFRQKFAEAEVTPRASFWDQLDHELVVQQNEQVVQENVSYRRRLVLHRWVAAACLLLALGFGGWAFLWQKGHTTGPDLVSHTPPHTAGTTATMEERVARGSYSSGAVSAAGELASSQELGTSDITTQASEAEFLSGMKGAAGTTPDRASLGNLLSGLYSSSVGVAEQSGGSYSGYSSRYTSAGLTQSQALQVGFGAMSSRTAQLRSLLGLGRPDTLKPSLLAAPQPVPGNLEVAAVKELEQPEAPKLWRRLRLGGGYAVGSYNPNINFSHTDGRLKADPVTNALRNYYQDEAENEYRRNLRAGTSQRVALAASYALNDRWSILSGAEVAEQRATSATTYGFVDGKQLGREAADLFNRPAAYNMAPVQPRVTSYRYRTATVPVGVHYGARKPGLSVYARVGAAVSVLLSSRSELDGSPETTRTHNLGSSESPYRRVLTTVRGGTGVRYQPAAASWSVNVGPAVEAGLTTLNANPSQRTINQSRPYSIGVEASVEFGSAKNVPVVQ